MQLGRKAAQVGGSVRDRRMNTDEKKGGGKVNNAEEKSPNGGGIKNYRMLRRTEFVGASDKRKSVGKSEVGGEVVEPRSPIQLRKSKSESFKEVSAGAEKKAIEIRKTKSDCGKSSPVQRKSVSSGTAGTRSDSQSCNEVRVGGEKSNVCNNEAGVGGEKGDLCNVGEDQTETKTVVGNDEEEKDKGVVEEIEIEEKAIVDIKKVSQIPEEDEEEEDDDDYIDDEEEEEEEEVLQKVVVDVTVNREEKTVDYTDKIHEQYEKLKETQSKIQNLVDLVMWKDVSKSSFVLGVGSFVIISSSYTKDVNFSIISALSYMGLLYLAATFFYKSILCRGSNIHESNHHLVGEEEAAWLLHLILPYLNGFLFHFRSLFCGDPATTLKLAVILFVLAQCGSSITLWKMTKLGFFGAFMVPKICSSYSKQLIEYANFWRRRVKDAWDSCSHKKAIAAATFTLIWNLSSVTARVWAVFMLVVAIRYYQQSLCLLRSEWEEEQEINGGEELYHQAAHERIQIQSEIANKKKDS